MAASEIDRQLTKVATVIEKMADPDIFIWLGRQEPPSEAEIRRAATIVADRLCGAFSNPIVRNAQEKRQLAAIKAWLETRGYKQLPAGRGTRFDAMPPGTFGFRMNVSVKLEGGVLGVNIPIDAVIMPKKAKAKDFPVLFEAKSAGDFTNTNKRPRKKPQKWRSSAAPTETRSSSISFYSATSRAAILGTRPLRGLTGCGSIALTTWSVLESDS